MPRSETQNQQSVTIEIGKPAGHYRRKWMTSEADKKEGKGLAEIYRLRRLPEGRGLVLLLGLIDGAGGA
jgi:hypothetical protein